MNRTDDGRAWPWLQASDGDAVRAVAPRASVRAHRDGRLCIAVDGVDLTLDTPLANPQHARLAAFRYERAANGCVERAAVLPDRAAVSLAWECDSGRAHEFRAALAMPVSVLALEPRRVVLRTDDEHGVVLTTDRDVDWRFEADADAFGISVAAAAPLRIAIATCTAAGGVDRALDAVLRDAALAERVIAAAAGRVRAMGPMLACAEPALVDAFEWARACLSAVPPADPFDEAAWLIPARVASGDSQGARSGLDSLPAPESPLDAAAFVVAHARYVDWSGTRERRAPLIRALTMLDEAMTGSGGLLAFAVDGTLPVSRAAIVIEAVRAGALLAESIDRTRAATLASCARRARATFEAAHHSSALIVDDDAGLARAVRATDADLLPAPRYTRGAVVRSWGDLESGAIRAGGAALGVAAAMYLSDLARGDAGPRTAAALIQGVVSGLLGIAPDALRDRLVLRPRVAPRLLPLSVRGIRVGEASFDLGLEDMAMSIEQTGGAVPLQVVLEPWFATPTFHEVRLDGGPVDLTARPADGGWVFAVQLAADRPRRLEVVPDARAGPP